MEFYTSKQDWEAQLKKENKTDSIESIINATLQDELTVPAYLTATDSVTINNLEGLTNTDFKSNLGANNWDINVNISINDSISTANEKALELLKQNVSSITFIGNEVSNQDELILLLRNIDLSLISLKISAKDSTPAFVFMLLDELSRRKYNTKTLKGAMLNDPLGDFAITGFYEYNLNETIAILKATIESANTILPNYKQITVNAANFAYAGATAVQELALALSLGVEYATLLKSDLDIQTIANTMAFNFAVNSNYFVEIAKLRAFRILWDLVLQTIEPNKKAYTTDIYTETAINTLTAKDTENNIVRATIQSLASTIGGANSHTVTPYNFLLLKQEGDLPEQVALHLQHILKHESAINSVFDPSKGSFYIENLTNELVSKALELFKTYEADGGFLESLHKGTIQTQLTDSLELQKMAIDHEKAIVIGINKFKSTEKDSKTKNPFTIKTFGKEHLIEPIELELLY